MAKVSDLALIVLYPMLGSFDQERYKAPSHCGKSSNGLTGILADCHNRLRGRDIVARTPLVLLGDCAEILLNELLSPRQSITPTHETDYLRFLRKHRGG